MDEVGEWAGRVGCRCNPGWREFVLTSAFVALLGIRSTWTWDVGVEDVWRSFETSGLTLYRAEGGTKLVEDQDRDGWMPMATHGSLAPREASAVPIRRAGMGKWFEVARMLPITRLDPAVVFASNMASADTCPVRKFAIRT